MKLAKALDEPTYKEQILVYMRHRAGQDLTTGEIAGAISLSREQAASALHNLARRSMPDQIRHVGDGVWRYRAAAEGELSLPFVIVGKTPDGQVILADTEGTLYRAIPLTELRTP